MDRKLFAYVASVIVLAVVILGLVSPHLDWSLRGRYLVWLLACLAAEHLWLSSITGKGSHSMVSTFNFVVIALLPLPAAVWIVSLAALIASSIFQKRIWYRVLFNGAQMVITTFVASGAFRLLGGDFGTVENLLRAERLLPWALAGLVYHVFNTGLVAGAISLQSAQRYWDTWRENFGYRDELLSSAAMLLMSPIALVVFLALDLHNQGFWGLILFYVPLLFIRDSHVRYIELVRATDDLIKKERSAATGEMAAGVAHDINNYLAPIMGRAQMLILQADRLDADKVAHHAQIVFENAANMAILAKGLAGAGRETHMTEASLSRLARDTVEFLKPQKKYREIAIELRVDDGLPTVSMDPGQIQQVLINLLSNAADALEDRPDPRIVVTTAPGPNSRQALLKVSDNGIGIPPENMEKIFEPRFTTKGLKGHGFGLSNCFAILERHRGRLTVASRPGEGAEFTATLPISRSKAA